MNSCWLGKFLGLMLVMAGLILAGVGSCLAATGYQARGWHDGELVNSRHLVEVTVVDGQIRLTFARPKPISLAPDFTMSYCGQELPPIVTNLNSMIGKASKGWIIYVNGNELLHRLEFQCQ